MNIQIKQRTIQPVLISVEFCVLDPVQLILITGNEADYRFAAPCHSLMPTYRVFVDASCLDLPSTSSSLSCVDITYRDNAMVHDPDGSSFGW